MADKNPYRIMALEFAFSRGDARAFFEDFPAFVAGIGDKYRHEPDAYHFRVVVMGWCNAVVFVREVDILGQPVWRKLEKDQAVQFQGQGIDADSVIALAFRRLVRHGEDHRDQPMGRELANGAILIQMGD